MVNIILPISRSDYLKPVFDCLDKLKTPKNTELLIILDGDLELKKKVEARLDNFILPPNLNDKFAKIQLVEFGENPAETINERRYRISAIHNKAKHYVNEDCDYVLLLEDDTVYPDDTLKELKTTFDAFDNVGYVTGVELGRHKSKYVGAWVADNNEDPRVIESVMPSNKMYEKISAGGLYCCLVRSNLYTSHNFEPFDKVGTNGLSCDVNFGLDIIKRGYNNYINWNIECDHIGEKGSVNLGNTIPQRVRFTKTNDWMGVVVQ